jgi:predicted ATP-dependent protease
VTLVAGALRDPDAAEELFGSQEGAEVKPGLLEEAGDGTLFIHEVEDLTSAARKRLSIYRLTALPPAQETRRPIRGAPPGRPVPLSADVWPAGAILGLRTPA